MPYKNIKTLGIKRKPPKSIGLSPILAGALWLIIASAASAELAGDLSGNGYVDGYDLFILCEHWLEDGEPECLGDADEDCDADLFDFATVLQDWLKWECNSFTATASSRESPEYSASMSIDGGFSTRWSSTFSDNQWLQLDLGQIRSLYGLEICWEEAYAEEYDIAVSNDASNWTTVFSTNIGDGGYDNIDFAQQSAQYLRINCVQRATPWGNSIWEVFVKTDDHCTPFDTWVLAWSDEFDGTEINPANWEHQIGDGCDYGICGWGNNEWEYYTARPENSYVENGNLVIVAREEQYMGFDYTSARLRTANKQDFLYGRLEARIKLPTGQGMWPAFWMLPTDWVYGGWAASGEIDIMEAVNIPTTTYGTIHYGGEWSDNTSSGGSYSAGVDFSEDFHLYTLVWEPTEMRWFVDGNLYSVKNDWWSSGGPFPAPFDQHFHFLLNIAVGGNWPGYPDETTVFPQQMLVDYVRVYQRNP